MFATSQTKGRSILAMVIFLTAVVAGGQAQAVVKEMDGGLFLLLAGESESCTDSCSKSSLTCSVDSLKAAAVYGTSSAIAATVSEIGGKCSSVRAERVGRPFPLIDARNRCFPAPIDRIAYRYDCDSVSTMGQPGRRICACFGEPRSTRSPTPAPNNGGRGSSPYVPRGFSLSWRDDFDGPKLNTTNWSRGLVYDEDPSQHVVWNPRNGGPHLLNSNYHGYVLDEDSYIKNGKLVLANREHNPPITGTAPTGKFQYSSGWVNSLRKRYYNGSKKGPYLEARARFPSGLKVWPAIWLVSETLVWPPEIDIWEYFGTFFNFGVDEMHLRNIWGEWPNKVTHNIELVDFHEHYSGYRTLGWLWTDEEMTWYIDGAEVATKQRGIDIPYADWPNEDFFLILNNGLMREVDGSTTSFPNYFEIDYIALFDESDKVVEPPVAEYVVLLGKAGESCTSACARDGMKCSVKSLKEGDLYTSKSKIAATAAAVGVSCAGGVHAEKDWDVNPLVSSENYCFPTPSKGRVNQNCDATSPLVTDKGELQGHRICSCEVGGTF